MIDNLKTGLDTVGTYIYIGINDTSLDIAYSTESTKEILDLLVQSNSPEGYSLITSSLTDGHYKANCRKDH